MCGIAGIVRLSPTADIAADHLRVMANQLTHRGPDDEGLRLDPEGRCGFGFRRLAIIDIAGGHQPLSNEDGTVWAVCNGEIYNFRELRQTLEQRGHRFATASDAEVIVHAYEEHGLRCFEHLAGMFAIAVWDQAAGRLVLARDRLGKKPLTYAVLNDRLYFASEAKAILALRDVPREIDPQSLHRYLLFQYVPAPHSIFRGFHRLPPGTSLCIAADSGIVGQPAAYWRIPQPAPFGGTYADAKSRLGELLTAAVRKRLIADVPLGAFLSGGVDSSIIVGLMRKLGVSPLRTFSIGFSDARYDETAYARLVARHFRTEHNERTVTVEARALLNDLAWHYDEPFADSSAIPTLYLARWARQSVTVALTGDAGDECFAGYDRYRAAELAARLDWLPAAGRRVLARLGHFLPHGRAKSFSRRAHRFLTAIGQEPARRYAAWIHIFAPQILAEGYRAEFAARIDFAEPLRWFNELYDEAPGLPADRALRTDFASYLPYDLLTKVDIASMATGLECRSPFLDHDLVEFALSLPLHWRLGPQGGKRILKDWAADLLPPEIMNRPKMGFGVPVGEWFRGELRGLLQERLLDAASLSGRVLRRDWLERFIEAHLSGYANNEHQLWALLMLELWRARWQPRGC